MSNDTLLFDLTDKVAVITLNRPAVRNALNRELGQALMETLQRVRTDEDIRVAVLTGAGRTFCAGADLKERAQSGRAADASVASVIEASHVASFARLPMEKPLLRLLMGIASPPGSSWRSPVTSVFVPQKPALACQKLRVASFLEVAARSASCGQSHRQWLWR